MNLLEIGWMDVNLSILVQFNVAQFESLEESQNGQKNCVLHRAVILQKRDLNDESPAELSDGDSQSLNIENFWVFNNSV